MQAFERMHNGIANKGVFFDFDKYAIKPNQVSTITDNAKLAATYSNDYLTLQGNCDERGSREYDLALGQRRADAVKQRVLLLGIPEARIETVSFGNRSRGRYAKTRLAAPRIGARITCTSGTEFSFPIVPSKFLHTASKESK